MKHLSLALVGTLLLLGLGAQANRGTGVGGGFPPELEYAETPPSDSREIPDLAEAAKNLAARIASVESQLRSKSGVALICDNSSDVINSILAGLDEAVDVQAGLSRSFSGSQTSAGNYCLAIKLPHQTGF